MAKIVCLNFFNNGFFWFISPEFNPFNSLILGNSIGYNSVLNNKIIFYFLGQPQILFDDILFC